MPDDCAQGVAIGVPSRVEAAARSGYAKSRDRHQDTAGPIPVYHWSTRPRCNYPLPTKKATWTKCWRGRN